ncbi:citrate (pro-3S)-lyase subunit beta [Acidaminobacter sp. JC074]|uniref:citrate (pro-3S)-lyase subunit beta n=1 Tax=Acidaminobacter sp. JC074 TaxID=2530199 RepID=UPI001F0DCE15|nr:citrate (pro-3S)-lyase subunit beta [Acidaminobacter sp. JC074]MCH4890682.1 citrate (pro-3S)-lyase subunit beta [Acidaminobacter sp. JC074]
MGRLRRTMMYVPGNNPAMLTDAHIYGADSLMFDLEDSVSLKEKDSARLLVYNLVKRTDYETEIVVRVNGLDTPFGHDDIVAMVRAGVDVIRLPKTDSKDDVLAVEAIIESTELSLGLKVGTTKMMAAIESPLGIVNVYEIAKSSDRLIGIAIGAEDFVTNMRTNRSKAGVELLAARSQIVLAARAAGIAALDTVFSDIEDECTFRREVALIKQLGFDGKSVINPRQIDVVHEIYQPSDEEVDYARQVIFAIQEAEKKGLGVVSVNGKMVDKPIVERARRVLSLLGGRHA